MGADTAVYGIDLAADIYTSQRLFLWRHQLLQIPHQRLLPWTVKYVSAEINPQTKKRLQTAFALTGEFSIYIIPCYKDLSIRLLFKNRIAMIV